MARNPGRPVSMTEVTARNPVLLPPRAGSPRASDLSEKVLDVVTRRLDVDCVEAARLERLLSRGERQRADRLRLPERRRAFVVGRGRLRELLGLVLGSAPINVPLEMSSTGKPRLSGSDGRRLRFNVAHSEGLALYGLTLDHEIGIDVERVDETLDWEDVAARSFAPAEQRALAATSPGLRRAAFFDCWVRKEAVIKATGDGLGRRLSSFVVSVTADRAAMLSCESSLGTPERWLLMPVPVLSTHRAAVAVPDGAAVETLRIWS